MTDRDAHYLEKELFARLREEGTAFAFLQRAALDGLWYLDLENPEHEWMSPEFWELLGYDPATRQHLTREWQDLINPDDLVAAQENLKRHCEDPTHPYDQVVRYRHRDGSIVWVRCRGVAIRDASGKPIRMLGAHNDMTALMRMKERYQRNLKSVDDLYATTRMALEESASLFEQSPDAMLEVEADGAIVKANREASRLLGYSNIELTSMSVDALVPGEFRDAHPAYRQSYMKDPSPRPMGATQRFVYAVAKSGAEIPVDVRLSTIKTRFGEHTIATVRDISSHVALVEALEKTIEQNQVLSQQAITDALTGVRNRRYFEETIQSEFSNSRRHGQSLTAMLVDIDHFKRINDQFGHGAGDAVLTELGHRLTQLIRGGDTLARIGGEEFAVLLPMTDTEAATTLAERMRQRIADSPFATDSDEAVDLTISIGVASLRSEDASPDDLMQRADEALYAAKRSGRNRVCVA